MEHPIKRLLLLVNQTMGLVTGGNKTALQAVLAIMSQLSW